MRQVAQLFNSLDPSPFHERDLDDEAEEFLDAKSYTNVLRWAKEIHAREPVKRGRMVNRIRGEPHEQLRERHDASDFKTKTQDKVEAAG